MTYRLFYTLMIGSGVHSTDTVLGALKAYHDLKAAGASDIEIRDPAGALVEPTDLFMAQLSPVQQADPLGGGGSDPE